MKKLLLLFAFVGLWTSANAQFFQGFGVTIGGTYSNQKGKLTNEDNFRQRYKLSFNGSVFAEMFDHDYTRWITEVEYNRKGARQRFPIDDKSAIRANYVSWNNYLKFRQELYDVTPYWYIGPKVEYLLNGTHFPYSQIHVTGATGVGIELLSFDPWFWFLDFQWNPDIMPSMNRDLPSSDVIPPDFNKIRHNAFELKLGLKFKGQGKRTTCPAYMDPA